WHTDARPVDDVITTDRGEWRQAGNGRLALKLNADLFVQLIQSPPVAESKQARRVLQTKEDRHQLAARAFGMGDPKSDHLKKGPGIDRSEGGCGHIVRDRVRAHSVD